MGCSSYLAAPDPQDASRELCIQFKYGFLRELHYRLNDEIDWADGNLPVAIDLQADAFVPAWTTDGARHFGLQIHANRIVGLREIPEAEADFLFEHNVDRNSFFAWIK